MVLDRKRFPTPDLKGYLTPMLKTYNGFIAHIQSSLSGPQRPARPGPGCVFTLFHSALYLRTLMP